MRAFLVALVLALATAVPAFADGGGDYQASQAPLMDIGAADTSVVAP
jgi:hypothetical protein